MSQYVVVDLEMCRVPAYCRTEKFQCKNETIQIGAVLLDDSFTIIRSFDTYVYPEYGALDPFIEGLTGITYEQLAQAPLFSEAIQAFCDWLPQDVKFVEWSKTDLLQLCHELNGKQIPMHTLAVCNAEAWIDCQSLFSETVDSPRRYNLTEALNLTNIEYREGAHNGYVDAYNTALLFAQLNKNPDLLRKAYDQNMEGSGSGLTFLMGDLFNGLQLQF